MAKAQLDITLPPTGERWTIPNEDASIVALVVQRQTVHPTLIVLEATGGFHLPLRSDPAMTVPPSLTQESSRTPLETPAPDVTLLQLIHAVF